MRTAERITDQMRAVATASPRLQWLAGVIEEVATLPTFADERYELYAKRSLLYWALLGNAQEQTTALRVLSRARDNGDDVAATAALSKEVAIAQDTGDQYASDHRLMTAGKYYGEFTARGSAGPTRAMAYGK
jgi:hypothetical protein